METREIPQQQTADEAEHRAQVAQEIKLLPMADFLRVNTVTDGEFKSEGLD